MKKRIWVTFDSHGDKFFHAQKKILFWWFTVDEGYSLASVMEFYNQMDKPKHKPQPYVLEINE